MKRKMCLGGGLLLVASSAIITLAACSSFNLHKDNVIRNADGISYEASKVFGENDGNLSINTKGKRDHSVPLTCIVGEQNFSNFASCFH